MMEEKRGQGFPESVARIVSITFHPLLMPLYGLLLIFFAPTLYWYLPFRVKEILFFIFLINNVIIPLSLLPFLKYRQMISSWSLTEQGDRVVPLLLMTVLYSATSFIMFRLQIPGFLKAYTYSLLVLSMVLFVINLKWKISLHSAAAGAMTALVFLLSFKMSVPLPLQTAIIIVLSGIVISARLFLNTHTPRQAYSGFATGLLVQGLFMIIFQ